MTEQEIDTSSEQSASADSNNGQEQVRVSEPKEEKPFPDIKVVPELL